MTRKEEIEQAIRERCLSSVSVIFFRQGAEWADAHQPSPWTSVEDRLPEKLNKFFSDFVLVMYTRGGKPYPFITRYDYECGMWEIENVTHWMPIPESQTTK